MRRVLIECGAAETRAALLLDGEPVRFHFGPARGDEALPRSPERGDIYSGRIRTVSKSLSGAFIDIGEGEEGFLPYGKAPPVEGELRLLRVTRPAIGTKGPALAADWEKGLGRDAAAALEAQAADMRKPGPLGAPVDAAIRALLDVAPADAVPEHVTIDRPEAARAIRDYCENEPAIADSPFAAFAVDEEIEAALERTLVLPGGARMTVDETEALVAVDIDSAGASGGVLNDKVNEALARQLFIELSRRSVGGRVVVDFLPPSGSKARARLEERLDAARRGVYDCRPGKLRADGLYDLTAPRHRRSLLEEASEPAGGALRQGRRFTLDWRAKAAIRALQAELTARQSARFRLVAGDGIAGYLERERPQWTERLAARYGARFSIVSDSSLKERDFDVAEQR